MKARARRSALIAASVPDETNRTCSIDGTASTTARASSTSISVGAPNVVPRPDASLNGPDDRGMGVARDQRPPRHHPVDIAVAVGVPHPAALATGQEERVLTPNRSHGANRARDAAGDEISRFGEELGRAALCAGAPYDSHRAARAAW